MSDPEVMDAGAVAFRVAGHGLHERVDPLRAVAACGLQEYPPGHAEVALHARAGEVPDDHPVRALLVTVNAMRGAPYVVPRADVAVFTRALVPEEEAGLRALVGSLVAKELEAAGHGVGEALDLVADAAREGLAGGPLGRDAFHQALRERLPDGLLPWCRGCGSHHVRPGLWRALGPLGVTEMPDRAVFALAGPGDDPGDVDLPAARRELVRRFLRAYGPSTHTALASWAGTAPAHARRLFASVADELTPVRQAGARRWVLTEDLDRLLDPPPATGVRLLHGHDPFVAGPDRAALVPDPATRKALFPAVGRPGVVLVDGRVAGLWRARKRGRTLELTVDGAASSALLGDAPEVLARLRGCARATVV
ncbi:unannotated protein [freshwater metagenome]|uniref:Unannotated protein n=1 Tax=freshwater metagenome TaxID=449393 RepID=A0A6J7GXR2_9ZZZZ|nr:hypothetical protein [Actinomycetota bacterium]